MSINEDANRTLDESILAHQYLTKNEIADQHQRFLDQERYQNTISQENFEQKNNAYNYLDTLERKKAMVEYLPSLNQKDQFRYQ